jgi:hypothetical protein
MELNDIIGSIGVTMMLSAYIMNLTDRVDDDDLRYILLNFFGGILACIASIMIKYIPFVILEGVWTLVSGWGIIDYYRRQKIQKNVKIEKKVWSFKKQFVSLFNRNK